MPTRKKKPSKSKTPLSDLRNAAGDPQIADRFYIVAMGASAYLEKPVSLHELARLVRKVLGG